MFLCFVQLSEAKLRLIGYGSPVTQKRWREIERLYHSAREHGVAVLDGTDPELRLDVERLLAQDETGKVLDRPASEILTELMLPVDDRRPDLSGRTFGHFEIVEKLGAGGMGVVYKAIDLKLNRPVALKFLPPELSHDEDLKRRLAAEARAASALDHPNIVVIHEISNEGGELFIAMAFHEGVTLQAKLAQGIPVTECLRIARQVASGLARAHEHGIIHRDIKPSNIVIAKDGIVRIIDFGIAQATQLGTVTSDGVVRGTPLYMSPEQASGLPADSRSDVWSLGVVLYEMLAGLPPFLGKSALSIMRAVMQDEPPSLLEVRPEISPRLESIVRRALQKDPGQRYQSASGMEQDLTALLADLEGPPLPNPKLRAAYLASALLLLAATVTSVWFYQRSQRQLATRQHLIPEISRLAAAQKPLGAFRVASEALKLLPADQALSQQAQELFYDAGVKSSPAAFIEIKDYLSPADPWYPLGTTPVAKARIPSGYLRWRVTAPNLRPLEAAPMMKDMFGFFREFDFPLEEASKAPEDMVFIPAVKYTDYVWSLGDFGPYDLPAHYMDRLEVTNRKFQQFVDSGGYRKREYWKEGFLQNGSVLSWEAAMQLLRDATGRPGPSTWKAGHFPEGQGDYPVEGISWYEAAAYAGFAGKSLPVIAQWLHAAPSSVARYVVEASNFSNSLAAAGKYQGLGPFGTSDMAGNVAEWCWNSAGSGTRFLLGGAYNSAASDYFEPGAMPSFDRSAGHGFRCVRNLKPVPRDATLERRQTVQDFSKAKPATDQVYEAYKSLYSYDRAPLNPKTESVQDSTDWRREKIVIDAAYNRERLPLYLFLPPRARKPYQAVIYFPTARALSVLGASSSEKLADWQFIDYVIQSGRAVIYPVYKGTYERSASPPSPDTVAGRESLILASKDIGRTIDYLETRADIDRAKISYMGTSMGASIGIIFVAVESRFKTAIFLDGGFVQEKMLPGSDQADFAPRLKVPTLLITGNFDWIFLGKSALMNLLGTPPADRKAVLFNTSHDVGEQRLDLIREVTSWLDHYFGKVD